MKKIQTRAGVLYIDPKQVAMIATPKDPSNTPALGVCLVFLVGSTTPIIVELGAGELAQKLGLEAGEDPKQLRLGIDPTRN